MANIKNKVAYNVSGDFYVDSSCINCDTCRKFAPAVFGESNGTSHVKKQPQVSQEVHQALQALVSCPVHAIGAVHHKANREILDSFPHSVVDDIFVNGFNAESSFGADSYFVRSFQGNWLIDAPRFHPLLIEKFQKLGGLSYIFLTHRDDVADAEKYAKAFHAKRIIHKLDASAQPDSELILQGTEDVIIGDSKIIFTPGHTRGHCVLLWKEKYLFTGDHLPWDDDEAALRPFRDACWYSWKDQIESVAKLANYHDVEWVLPGHGRRRSFEKGAFTSAINEAVKWMS